MRSATGTSIIKHPTLSESADTPLTGESYGSGQGLGNFVKTALQAK